MTNPQPTIEGGVSEVEIISQQVEEETKSIAPVPLVNFAYRDLPLATLDVSVAGSQLLSNLDEEYQREGSNWLKPCCGRRAAVWQVFLLSASLNSFLVACVVLVVILLTLELLIDIKLLQFSSASQFAGVIHWISLVILSVFFSETILRIVVLGIWDYIENKIEVFDGAVIILSLAPMVASTVANGPSSPWDAISLIITLRIWRVKRIIDAYVLPMKVEMEMMIQQYEKAKVIQDEHLERLTQICQEQGFEIRQLRAHLAQQDLDLAAEREAALQVPHVLNKQSSNRYKVVAAEDSDDETTENITELRPPQEDDMNNYISRYYNEPSSDTGVPEATVCKVTAATVDIHRSNISSDLLGVELPPQQDSTGQDTSGSASLSTLSSGAQACSWTLASSPDCSSTCQDTVEPGPSPQPHLPAQQQVAQAVVQELLSSMSKETYLAQQGPEPASLKLPMPAAGASPDLHHQLSIYNGSKQDGLDLKPLSDCPQGAPVIEQYGVLGPLEPRLGRATKP
ncbi:transmembrane protein 266 [Apus apus]|uniref:transmembrane protein 266 n=1 Tax=Apus apus TaxID=8895 RepID=UPI0021F8D896|nr:transmembrane protein 266 [Apus apus]XP_051484597.1 transmembrane protein 266 [Apus apus]XP_051484598.1 transmembrane protein 266 [Apus apus]XP_051484599.1 transmembrane protein 266 [Apus apus]XP_051484600.1 transmembrane protein 266 [Apus apus]XP_051484602.1 transmembrane protein 266 [Apus apus]XP_051484603.1 transmembrane protein 266 [Apus apus]XP_051484604.1 transmembrane protein 266 [Apus apus]